MQALVHTLARWCGTGRLSLLFLFSFSHRQILAIAPRSVLRATGQPAPAMDTPPQHKRGKISEFELVWQFAPHTTAAGHPKPVSKLVALGNRTFLSCASDELKVWDVAPTSTNVVERGALRGCKPFIRGYVAAAVRPGSIHFLPQGGFVAAGVASLHQANRTLLFATLSCEKVLEVEVDSVVSGIVSLSVAPSGNVIVGGLKGVAVELSFANAADGHAGRVLATMPGHEGEVQVFGGLAGSVVACGSAGSKLISDGRTDACLRLWRGGRLLGQVKDQDENVRCFCASAAVASTAAAPGADFFVTGSSDSSWVLRAGDGSGVQRNSLPLNWNDERASILAVTCIGGGASDTGVGSMQVITGDDDKPGRMAIWNGADGLQQVILHPHEVCGLAALMADSGGGGGSSGSSSSTSSSSSSSSSDVISACQDGFVRIWSRDTPAQAGAATAQARAAFQMAVAAANKARAHTREMARGGGGGGSAGGASAGVGGVVDDVHYEHTMSIALDDSGESGQAPIRIGFNQAEYYKDVAARVATRHGPDAENVGLLEKAVRAQQEQAAGPPRNLGPPGEQESAVKFEKRALQQVCCRQVQQSGTGHADLAKQLAKFNGGLRARQRGCALNEAREKLLLETITVLEQKTQVRRRTRLLPLLPSAPTAFVVVVACDA
jgi:WD40 repeat protein